MCVRGIIVDRKDQEQALSSWFDYYVSYLDYTVWFLVRISYVI